MATLTNQPSTLTPDTGNTFLLQKIAALEGRLAALETIITCPPGGGVAIVSPGSLKIQVGGSCAISIGSNLALSVGKDQTISVGGAHAIQAVENITLTTGSAIFVMKRSGDIGVTGTKISMKSSGEMVLKGSKITEN